METQNTETVHGGSSFSCSDPTLRPDLAVEVREPVPYTRWNVSFRTVRVPTVRAPRGAP